MDNAAGRLSDDPAAPLSAVGRAEAEALAAALAGCGATALICSPAQRALHTVAPLAAALGLRPLVLPALAERRLGALAGRARAEVREGPDAHLLTSWAEAPAAGESLRSAALRASAALAALPPAPTRVVVSHAGVLRALLGALDDTPTAERGARAVPNAQPIHKRLRPDAMAALHGVLSAEAAAGDARPGPR